MKLRLDQFYILAIIFTTSFLFSGCSKDEEPRFTIPLEIIVFFPAEFNTVATHTTELFSVPNFLQSRLAQNGMTADQITSIVAGRGQIIPVSPSVQYQVLNNVIVNVSSANSDDVNEMYYNDFIDFDHSGNLELLSSISELKDIMSNGVFDLQVKYNLRQGLIATTEHKLKFDLLVYD